MTMPEEAKPETPEDAELRAKMAAIMNDASLNPIEKARAQQALMNAKWLENMASDGEEEAADAKKYEHLNCSFCHDMCERPVTAPCGHNYCLKCVRKWINQNKKKCPTCRADFTKTFINNPRINTMLIMQIREALKPAEQRKAAATKASVADETRPDDAFMTENAKRKGLSNACSGRMRVTSHPHHFGPIGPEFDPERSQGILVGEVWQNRLHCRQWGAHLPHVAGIAGQSEVGAQSVVLSGGYEDDRDEGEWFLYTGSGGRDLSGNKRTSKEQSSDQKFELYNKSLLKSCERGLPVRVVRSFKEKRSAYAPTDPEWGVRYDGIYRIEACWRTKGNQGMLMCRFLFRRCDNEPAPWVAGTEGDGPWKEELPAESVAEIEKCAETKEKVYRPTGQPFWAYDDAKQRWGWTRDPPAEAAVANKKPTKGKSLLEHLTKEKGKAERELNKCRCPITKCVLVEPVVTPCGHIFSKGALVARFADGDAAKAEATSSARTFRVRKQAKACPVCKTDLAECLETLQVNHALTSQIDAYREKITEAEAAIAEEKARMEAEKPVYTLVEDAGAVPSGEAANGWRVAVFWPDDDAWFEGGVTAFNATDGKHLVTFDDGDAEWYTLADERVKWYLREAAPAGDEDAKPTPGASTSAAGAKAAARKSAAASSSQAAAPITAAPADVADAAAASLTDAEGDGAKAQGDAPASALKAEASAAAQAASAAAKADAAAALAAQKEALYASFEDIDRGLIDGFLADQGDDVKEVTAMLKRMRNQERYAKRGPPKSTSKGSKKKGAAKGSKAKAAAADPAEAAAADAAAAADDDDFEDPAQAAQGKDAAASTSAAREDAPGTSKAAGHKRKTSVAAENGRTTNGAAASRAKRAKN